MSLARPVSRPVLHVHDLMLLLPVSPADDRLEVVLPGSGARTVWLRIAGTEWFEQAELQLPCPI